MRALVGVGVGPGDPDLITVKAVRALDRADLVLVPVLDAAETGRAEATVRAHVAHDRVRRVVFALDPDRHDAAWQAAAGEVTAAFEAGATTVAFATIGDPNVYSTFTALAAAVRTRLDGSLAVSTIPGITAMQDLAARGDTVLCAGTESLALLPLTAGLAAFDRALSGFDTVVAYKGGRHLPAVLNLLRERDRLDDATYGASLGLPGEAVRPAADLPPDRPGPYLSTLIVPARRKARP